MRKPSAGVVIGMDPHKRSVTIEVMTGDETVADLVEILTLDEWQTPRLYEHDPIDSEVYRQLAGLLATADPSRYRRRCRPPAIGRIGRDPAACNRRRILSGLRAQAAKRHGRSRGGYTLALSGNFVPSRPSLQAADRMPV